jgi:hypothetical protein
MMIEKAITKVTAYVCNNPNVRSAVAYLSSTLTVKATAQQKYRHGARGRTFILTIGKPNYREREFIKRCKTAGESLPLRQPQLRFWPKGK